MRKNGRLNLDFLLDAGLTPDRVTEKPDEDQHEIQTEDMDPYGNPVKEVPSSPGLFASTIGSIWRRDGNEWRQVSQRFNKDGYLKVSATSHESRLVHQLVLEAFVGPRPEGLECRHLNDVKSDNRILNLAWGTRGENAADEMRNRMSFKGFTGSPKLNALQVADLKNQHRQGVSIAKLAAKFGVTRRSVRDIIRGVTWKHVG